MSNKTLIILAAGMWSRYGWLKQIDEFWPHWETILEYSVFDAIQAWFTDVVFVIRKEFSDIFHEKLWSKIEESIKVHYVFQEMTSYIPEWFSVEHREKPWGTAHAILVAKDCVEWPFMVINADDWYGRSAFELMWKYLEEDLSDDRFAMVWYMLHKTLSPYWTVNRGACKVDMSTNTLQSVQEHHKIGREQDNIIRDELWNELEDHTVVSMNFWWFDNSMFDILESKFLGFIKEHGHEPKKEFYIPTVCDDLIKEWSHVCDVMISEDIWCGVTYPDDKTYVRSVIEAIVDWWTYPKKLR